MLLLAGCGYAWYLYSQVAPALSEGEAGTLDQIIDPNIAQNGERFYNLLVVGIDYDSDDDGRDYAKGKGMTDVILYVQIDRDNGKINALQIPRDTYYGEQMAGGKKAITAKINEVYANGPDQTALINNLANQIYELYKLPVDDYITIDMQAFKTMLNNMGGIEMYVPWDIITVDKITGQEDLVCTQGLHRISGDTAELILRNRNYATADYKRLETQQYFYAAVVRTFLEEYSLADYYTACKLVAHYINTSLDISEIWGLYATMTTVKPEDIYIVRAPGGGSTINEHKGLYYTDREAMADVLNQHFRDADMPVSADKLGLATGYEWPYGKNIDEGRTMGGVMQASGQDVPEPTAITDQLPVSESQPAA